MRFKTAIIMLSVCFLMVSSTAFAGEVSGTLLNPKGIPAPHIYESVNIAGSNPTGGTFTNATDNSGIFYNPNLAAGVYSQGFSEKESFELIYCKGLNVPAVGNTWNILQFSPASYCYGTNWYVSWHTWYAQSFRATGENVISVGLRNAGPAGGDVAVAVLDGDNPYASQIGPTRTLGVSSTNSQCAYWSAGEVPTVPGRMYTVRFTLQGGGTFSPFYQTVRWRMRMENPDGRSWVDGVETDEPLEMTVNMDDAGLINTMCCARAFGYTYVSQYAGQTFTAKGSSLLAITWLTGSNTLFAVSVHDGPGDGSGGPQIGPTKYVNGVAWDGRSVVTFAPDEVPTIPGHVYYVKLRLADNSPFVLYDLGGRDFYAGGQVYVNNISQNGNDSAMGIYEEKYSGSIDQPKVNISSFRVDSITSNSAVVRWSTDKLSDSSVDYGKVTPYTQNVNDSAAVLGHNVTLTGLEPNTMYHVRASSRTNGASDGFSKDMVFVTAPAAYNTMPDPGFESGAFGKWVRFGSGDIRITAPWLGGSGPRTGSYGLAGAANGGTVQGGAYQRVAAVSGANYRLSAWLFTHTEGDLWSRSYQAITRIGIDPTGGVNPNSASVVWSPYTNSPDVWTQVQMSATAASDHITVFLYGGNEQPITWSIFSFDDVVLTGPAPTDASISEALTDYPDGSHVSIGGVVCTATSAQAGAYYVESTDRSNGLRLGTTDSMRVGDAVTVVGFLRTRATGERYLANAFVVAQAPSTPIKPVCGKPVSLGGAALGQYCVAIPGTVGPYNVGTLMRTFGLVHFVGSSCYVSDGSMAGSGVRVETGGLANPPVEGQFIGVTGIVRLEGNAGAASVVLDPRTDADVRVF